MKKNSPKLNECKCNQVEITTPCLGLSASAIHAEKQHCLANTPLDRN